MLFCLYVNDLRDKLDGRAINHIFYADDLQIYLHTTKSRILEGISRLIEIAQLVSVWAGDSGLRLNAGKTKAIIFGCNSNVNSINEMGLPGVGMQSGGGLIPFSDEVVSLGVTLYSKLTWKPHVDQVTKKVNKALYSLWFIRACTTETLRKRLVGTLVQPHLDYTVICLVAAEKLRIRLQRFSNTSVRYIFGVRRDEHISPYRRRLGWLHTDSHRFYFAVLIMCKIIQLREPNYLAAFFTEYKPRRPCRGVLPELNIPDSSTKTGDGTFQVQCARLWNSLPYSLRHLPSYHAFKRAAHNYSLGLDP